MKVQDIDETDTLYIEFRAHSIVETSVLDENTVMNVDAECNVCAITFEHSAPSYRLRHLTVEWIAA